jgi:hypothetical protein
MKAFVFFILFLRSAAYGKKERQGGERNPAIRMRLDDS